jgi:hypothetical protein
MTQDDKTFNEKTLAEMRLDPDVLGGMSDGATVSLSAWEAVAAGVAMGAVTCGLSTRVTGVDMGVITDSVLASLDAEGFGRLMTAGEPEPGTRCLWVEIPPDVSDELAERITGQLQKAVTVLDDHFAGPDWGLHLYLRTVKPQRLDSSDVPPQHDP